MEFNIYDLLDGFSDDTVDIQPQTDASARRIKELTMKKIHNDRKPARRGLSWLAKVALAAAIIASLAIPVMAATGFHFTDWLDGLFTNGATYDDDLTGGSVSKNWEISGYVVEIAAENATSDGLTLTCEEWGNEEKEGTLTADGSFWLEQWDGSAYTAMTAKAEAPAGETKTIAPNQTAIWQISWADSYGTLESGSYRLGKTFTYTAPSGETQSVEFYAKFRVFNADMSPYIEKCKTALSDLLAQQAYHVTLTAYVGEGSGYDYYTSQVWKDGSNFLEELTYINTDGSINDQKGYLLRDGVGYKVFWSGDNALSGISAWENADWVAPDSFDLWYSMVEISDARVGEVYAEGNEIVLLNSSKYEWEEEPRYWELVYTLDEKDNLVRAQYVELPAKDCSDAEKNVVYDLQVHDTSASEIAKVIAAQSVDKSIAFSWQEEQALYPAGTEGVKTEGFVNTASQGTVTLDNVVTIAKAECTLEWQNTAVVSYDETAQMWKVELGFSQDDCVQIVYLNAQGITQLVVTK